MRSFLGIFLILPVLVSLPACGGSGKPKIIATVSGTVSYKGAPLNSGTVVFHGEKGSFVGQIDSSGSYKVENPPLESLKVSVTTPTPGPGGISVEGVKPVQIPAKYAKVETSGLTYTVKEGDQTFNINLK